MNPEALEAVFLWKSFVVMSDVNSSADSPISRSKYKLFVISEQKRCIALHTLSKLGKKVRGYVISRSIIREVRKILARFKKILAQKVEEIRIEKISEDRKIFRSKKIEVKNYC